MNKSIKYYKLLVAFALITCSLFTGALFGQGKKKATPNYKTSAYATFGKDLAILKYIQLYKANIKVKPNNHCDDCLSLGGYLDFKLAMPKGKMYFVIVFSNWYGNEQKFSQNPISFLMNRNVDGTSSDMGAYSELNWKENSRYKGLIYKQISNSYFKNDSAKFQALIKWLYNNATLQERRSNAQLFLQGAHSYAHLGILDENSILRLNLSDLWIPNRKSFFLEDNKGSQKNTKSYENEAFSDNTGFMYKFILFSLTDNEVYESDVIEKVFYTMPKNDVKLVE